METTALRITELESDTRPFGMKIGVQGFTEED